eukprot:scaffold304156_cov19-Tisochrysis_lutea.AAC.1
MLKHGKEEGISHACATLNMCRIVNEGVHCWTEFRPGCCTATTFPTSLLIELARQHFLNNDGDHSKLLAGDTENGTQRCQRNIMFALVLHTAFMQA